MGLVVIWNWIWVISFFLLAIRPDAKAIFIELGAMIFTNWATTILSILMIYAFLPCTIPYSIKKILRD